MVEYLYLDSLAETTPLNVVVEVLIMANQFILPRLKELCESLLALEIHLEGVLSLLELSDIHMAPQLRNKCLDYILRHLYESIERGIFVELSDETLQALQERLDLQISDNAYQKDNTSNIAPPKVFLSAMEEEFRFSQPDGKMAKPKDIPLLSESNNDGETARVRGVRKKIFQIYRIEAKRARGERLDQAQTSKMYQKASLMQQLSDATGDSVETVRSSTMQVF